MIRSFYILFLLLFGILNAKTNHTIYINSIIDKEYTLKRWQATIDLLNTKLSPYHFTILPIKPTDIKTIKNKLDQKEISFLITQPAIYSQLKYSNSIYRILTMANTYDMSKFGSLFISHKDSDIKDLFHIKDSSIAAVAPYGFGGWLIAYDKLYENGIDPLKENKVDFLASQKKVIESILDKRYDVGVIKTGIIEKINDLEIKKLHFIDAKKIDDKIYSSTKLYPEWAFAVASDVDRDLVNRVFKILSGIKATDQEAIIGEYSSWQLPESYKGVDEIFKKFRLGHYSDLAEYKKEDIFKLISIMASFFILIIIFIKYKISLKLKEELIKKNTEQTIILNEASIGILKLDKNYKPIYVNRYLNTKLDMKSNKSFKITDYFSEDIINILQSSIEVDFIESFTAMKNKKDDFFPIKVKTYHNKSERYYLLFISDISEEKANKDNIIKAYDEIYKILSSITHQWKQPITSLGFMLEYLNEFLSSKKLEKKELKDTIDDMNLNIKYISDTIDDFQFFFTEQKDSNLIDKKGIEFFIKLLNPSLDKNHIKININFKKSSDENFECRLYASKSLLEHIFLNIINNSIETFNEEDTINDTSQYINIDLSKSKDTLKIIILDNAGGLKYINNIEKIFEPYFTTKSIGNGLGLYIVKYLIKDHFLGSIKVENTDDGLKTMIEFPLLKEK